MSKLESSKGIHPLSPEEARTVELSLNPIRRLDQLAELGAAYSVRKVGWSILPLYLTRGDLVRGAEVHQHAEELLSKINELPKDE